MWAPVPFDSREVREPYQMVGHSFKPLKGIYKPVCTGCGLVAGTNRLTLWAVDKGCDWKSHPGLRKARKTCSTHL